MKPEPQTKTELFGQYACAVFILWRRGAAIGLHFLASWVDVTPMPERKQITNVVWQSGPPPIQVKAKTS